MVLTKQKFDWAQSGLALMSDAFWRHTVSLAAVGKTVIMITEPFKHY